MTHRTAIENIHMYYKTLSKLDSNSWLSWTEKRLRFSITKANKFFIGIMLDQGQSADRAWDGGDHLVENHFKHKKGFWYGISETSLNKVTKICKRGYEETSYASNYNYNKFPRWLKSAANKMLTEYDGDPRNIWAISQANVSLIYDRLKEFDGIGDALAKMGQFILVRSYGVAGGKDSQHLMSIKPDNLVRRVMYRTGISPSLKVRDVVASTDKLHLNSPADFDAASWMIGRNYCSNSSPKCADCPISEGCKRVGLP
jgi:endonuclease III